jgi:hypothetical protein
MPEGTTDPKVSQHSETDPDHQGNTIRQRRSRRQP